eukprot:UN09841
MNLNLCNSFYLGFPLFESVVIIRSSFFLELFSIYV